MNFRKLAYIWTDSFREYPVFKWVDEIRRLNLGNEDFVRDYQKKILAEHLLYVNKNIPFYNKKGYVDIQEFPVIDKMSIKNSINEFLSKEYTKNNLVKKITSGSTGTPFVLFQNKLKVRRNTSDTLCFASFAGYELGEQLYYLKIWSSNNRKSKIKQFIENIIPIDVIRLTGSNVEGFISGLKRSTSKIHINSYASSLEEICKYLKLQGKERLIKKVDSVIVQSEALSDETKVCMENYFGAVACSRYSNVENGIIAQQTIKNNDLFLINRASYFVEILKINNDNEADSGEFGRIVITDLYNKGMAFVRYDTGDIGKFYQNEDGTSNYSYLSEIQGRKLDLILDTNGHIISSFIMYKNMFKYPEIDQYQLVQEDEKVYRFVICMKSKFSNENKLRKEFMEYLGEDAEFNVEYVTDVPLLSSGKRRKIVNNYINKRNNEYTN